VSCTTQCWQQTPRVSSDLSEAELAEKDAAWKGTDVFPVFCSALKLEMEVVKQHNLCEVQNIELQGSRQTGQQ